MPPREKEYFIILGAADLIRVRIRTEGGIVEHFTVQYEGDFGEDTRPIVRYDSAHGQPHCDTLSWNGQVRDKRWLLGLSNAEALTYAVTDVRANWRRYRAAFERSRR